MKGSELITLIKAKKLQDYEFCVSDAHCSHVKRSIQDVILWENAKQMKHASSTMFDTTEDSTDKIANLTK